MDDMPAQPRPVFRWWVLLTPPVVVLASILCAYPAYRDYQRREQIREKIQELGKALDSHEATLRAIPPLPAIEATEKK
jgi:hypothetical protein